MPLFSHPQHPHPHAPSHAASQAHAFHPLPVIGHPEAWYAKQIKQAEDLGDPHARASHKVGLHVTQALDPAMPWREKFRHFRHALKHYGHPPAGADEAIRDFYQKLAGVIRRYAGQEALKVVHREHERYCQQRRSGASRDAIAEEAELFFPEFVGHGHDCPEWISRDAWNHIREMEAEWI